MSALGLAAAAKADDQWTGRPVGAVYTATNGINSNEVWAYLRLPNGSLEFLDKYATGGRGSGGAIDPLQSQNSIVLGPNHRTLFTANSGSGDISEFLVGAGGDLSQIDRRPSGGGFPNAIAVHGDLVYVLNAGGAGNVTGFTMRNGRLDRIPGGTHALTAASAGGSSLTFSADGSSLVVTERLTNTIDVFTIGATGAITHAATNVSHGDVPFSSVAVPQGAFVVAEAAGNSAGGSAISSYTVGAGGVLDTVTASLPTDFNAACWIAATSDGQYAFVANAGSSMISTASIGATGALDILSAASAGTGAGTITGFKIGEDGALTLVSSTPSIPAASGQNGIAAY
jgi:6-phosphogluconolactonase